MKLCMLLFCITGYFSMTQAACPQPTTYYVDCGGVRTVSAAYQFCLNHQMTVLNLTNGTSLASDIAMLNTTLRAKNCVGYIWYSSGSKTGIVGDTSDLGGLVSGILDGVLGLVTNILCSVPLIFCPVTTTPAPILNAFTVCTRPIQQHVIQKCLTQVQRPDMQQFLFNEQSLPAGILDTFPLRSQMSCSGMCSSNDDCVGISFKTGICTLYM